VLTLLYDARQKIQETSFLSTDGSNAKNKITIP